MPRISALYATFSYNRSSAHLRPHDAPDSDLFEDGQPRFSRHRPVEEDDVERLVDYFQSLSSVVGRLDPTGA